MAGGPLVLSFYFFLQAELLFLVALEAVEFPSAASGVVGAASFRGGILSLTKSRPFASENEVILWFGENPVSAEKQERKMLGML